MPSSGMWSALTALVAAFRADSTIASLATVYDGPLPANAEGGAAVCVGDDGDPDVTEPGVEIDQTWAGLGAKRREEVFTIHCAIIVYSGDEIMSVRRDEAKALLDAVETLLRADPSIGGAVRLAELTTFALHQEAFAAGTRVRCPFTVRCSVRI